MIRPRIQRPAAFTRWRANPLAFIAEVICDPETGRPFHLLDAERTFLQHAFYVTPAGRLRYPEQLYSCPKKSGKTTFAAIHTLTLVLLFGGSYPEATLVANDLEQAARPRIRDVSPHRRMLAYSQGRGPGHPRHHNVSSPARHHLGHRF